jgi:hypothetical protein
VGWMPRETSWSSSDASFRPSASSAAVLSVVRPAVSASSRVSFDPAACVVGGSLLPEHLGSANSAYELLHPTPVS